MDLGVVHVGQRLNILVPISLVFGNIMEGSRHDGFVISLGLADGLWMIGGCCFMVDSKDGAHGLTELGYELGTIIGQN